MCDYVLALCVAELRLGDNIMDEYSRDCNHFFVVGCVVPESEF